MCEFCKETDEMCVCGFEKKWDIEQNNNVRNDENIPKEEQVKS